MPNEKLAGTTEQKREIFDSIDHHAYLDAIGEALPAPATDSWLELMNGYVEVEPGDSARLA
ncbi:hypothetical protein Caci_0716 [Catenulispora acidiphila DSM 44928]|uniref:Uncharacterized protein n=1 Tax=Catenulispora acidiphila (strain DSM 44928 / JCM 14897 / NBRC 102108 / NRRL B-24433 / ID139908) TaxID=479433 RepID=C7Q0M3_CATAD|nr:hypothetical protein Caci_0716 [Catenulispora acidiphila DSM 44928]